MSTGKIIATHRKNNGLTQEQLADHLHVSRQTIATWETAHQFPSDTVGVLAARFFNIDEEHLLKQIHWDKLHQRVDELGQRYDATITVKPTKEEGPPMIYLQENATQTVQGVTLAVTRIYKSIHFFDGTPNVSYGVTVEGPDKIHLYHRDEALIVHLLRKNTNDVIKLTGTHFSIEDNLGSQFPSGASGGIRLDESTDQSGVLFPRYDPKATSFTLRCDAVNGYEDDCDVLLFEDVPIDGEGVAKTVNDDTVTYEGIHWEEGYERPAIQLAYGKPREVRHMGVSQIIDNLGNSYGVGARSGENPERFILKEELHPDATSIRFKYLFARTILSFELRDLPLPS